MARFSIEKLIDSVARLEDRSCGVGLCINRAEADEIRRLLDEAFPVEQQPATENVTRDPDVTDVVAPSSSLGFDAQDWAREFRRVAKKLGYSDMDEGWLVAWFANAIMRGFDEHAKQQPARVIDNCCEHWSDCEEDAVHHLCDRHLRAEQPGPTIAQVIEACGGNRIGVTQWIDGIGIVRVFDGENVIANRGIGQDVPLEAAIRALYDDAVARLKQQRDEAEQKLAQLGTV